MAAAVEAAMAVSSRPTSSEHLPMPTSFNFADLVLPGTKSGNKKNFFNVHIFDDVLFYRF